MNGPGTYKQPDVSFADGSKEVTVTKPSEPTKEIVVTQNVNPLEESLKGMGLNHESRKITMEALKHSSDKAQFYRYFTKELGQKDGTKFYRQLRSNFDYLKKLSKEAK